MTNTGTKELYYITHIQNLHSILSLGILSHERIERDKIEFKPIYDEQIVSRRGQILAPDGNNLWHFANLYFQPRNPMLYRVLDEKGIDEIIILGIKPDILNRADIFISDGNAAHSLSRILPAQEARKIIPEIKREIKREWWTEEDGSKRKIMAECLVPDSVPAEFIQSIYVGSHAIAEKLRKFNLHIPIIPEPKMFFIPSHQIVLAQHLYLAEGDLFFSKMQTLTISVNVVGVMGKGLASRAKYQFPDVYVHYQDLCRKKILKMGSPYIYKRESSFYHQLADESSHSPNNNSETWFLLFPTKNHWRDKADLPGIEKGLQWLQSNYQKEGIKSLAMPALGCGLGKLDWKEVGPLLCKYLVNFNIPVVIYLPAEKKIPAEFLTPKFLLASK